MLSILWPYSGTEYDLHGIILYYGFFYDMHVIINFYGAFFDKCFHRSPYMTFYYFLVFCLVVNPGSETFHYFTKKVNFLQKPDVRTIKMNEQKILMSSLSFDLFKLTKILIFCSESGAEECLWPFHTKLNFPLYLKWYHFKYLSNEFVGKKRQPD